MQRKLLMLVVLLGTTGCVTTDGACKASEGDRERLREALLAHPETPADVGEAGTDLLIGMKGSCR